MKDTPCLPLTGVAIRTAAVKQTAGTTRVGLQPIEHGPSLPLITVAIRTAVVKRTAGTSRDEDASNCILRVLFPENDWWVPGSRDPDDACVLRSLFARDTAARQRVPVGRSFCDVFSLYTFSVDAGLYTLLRGKARASPEQISPSDLEHRTGVPVLSIQCDPAADYFCVDDLQMAIFGREGVLIYTELIATADRISCIQAYSLAKRADSQAVSRCSSASCCPPPPLHVSLRGSHSQTKRISLLPIVAQGCFLGAPGIGRSQSKVHGSGAPG